MSFSARSSAAAPNRPELYTQGESGLREDGGVARFSRRAGATDGSGGADIGSRLMCSEADPLDCHRCLLVGRALAEAGVEVGHILALGRDRRSRGGGGAAAPARTSRRRGLADGIAGGAPGRSLSRPRSQSRLCAAAQSLAASEVLRHPGESRGPGAAARSLSPWIPAFAGMTTVWRAFPTKSPHLKSRLHSASPRPSEGALSRGVAKAGRGAMSLRAGSQAGSRGGVGLPRVHYEAPPGAG